MNIGLTFVFGASLGWIVVKLLRPQPYIANLVLAICSAGNLGNILLIIIPAICKQNGSPFGDANACSTLGLSYVSYSMAVRVTNNIKILSLLTYNKLISNNITGGSLLCVDVRVSLDTKRCCQIQSSSC